MPRKYDLIRELYDRTLAGLTETPENWCNFLKSAAYQYKYPFADQVLIYAQKPGAIACGELELWNQSFGRWVNKGATGIALIAQKSNYTGLRYVFDVADTHNRNGQKFTLWDAKEEYTDEIVSALENRFGELGSKSTLVDAIISASLNLSEDNYHDYLTDLYDIVEGSTLNGLDDDNLKVRLLGMLQQSVAITVLTRLGYDADMYVDIDDLCGVLEFDTPETINCLGSAVSDVSEICLREIEKSVKALDRATEQGKIRTFDEREKTEYNKGENKTEKGGQEHGENATDLSRGQRRNDVSRPDSTGTDEIPDRQVRRPETGLSEGTSEGDLHDTSDAVPSERASARNRPESEGDAFVPYEPTGDEPWGNGTDEGAGPDEMGSGDEQHQSVGGGNNLPRSDLRISGKLPECMPDVLITALRHGDYLAKGKADIVSFLRSETNDERKTEYVRGLYTQDLYGELYKPGTKEYVGYHPTKDGLTIYDGHYLSRTAETTFTWDMTRKLIEALISDNNYLYDKEEEPQLSFADIMSTETDEQDATEKPEDEFIHEPVVQEPVKIELPQKRLAVSQEVIDSFLRLGGCTKNSTYRIYGYYRRANNPEENVEYLRAEYETDAVGIIVNGQKAAASWDDSGVTFAQGESVYNAWNTYKMSWAEIDKRIRELIEIGQYIGQSEAENAVTFYDNSVGAKITYIMRDFFRDKDIPFKPEGYLSWEDEYKHYVGVLNDPEKAEPFAEAFTKAAEEMTENPRRRAAYMPKFTAMLVRSYLRAPVDFPAQENILPPEHFFAQDQIDNSLIHTGSNVSQGKFRIYSFYLTHRDTQERARFLSNEYGIGGSSGMRGGDAHDSKGLALIGGLDSIGNKGVLLNWTQVAKRIDELIRKDRYLNAKEVAYLDTYEKEQVARAINGFYQDKGDDIQRPYERHENDFYEDRSADIVSQLDNKERLAEILGMMQAVFDSEMPGSRHYDYDKQVLETVNKYADGTFDLFPGAKSRRKTVTPTVREETPEPEEQPLDVDLSDTGYDLKLGTTVHIGKDECDVLSISREKVELFDGTLIPLEMPFDVFIRRIKENPLNDHLKKSVAEITEDDIATDEWDIPDDSTEAADNTDAEKTEKTEFTIPPAAEQYDKLKAAEPDSIAAVKVGDFYEFYGADAEKVSEVLELTLTSRSFGESERRKMCGFPVHKLDDYLHILLESHLKVSFIDDTKSNVPFTIFPQESKEPEQSDAEIAEILPEDGKEILRLYENRLSDDRFYLDSENRELMWEYFNPDSSDGGQILEYHIPFERILEVDRSGSYADFFGQLEEGARCYITDVTSPDFQATVYNFLTGQFSWSGFDATARDFILEEVEKAEAERIMPTLQEEKPKKRAVTFGFHDELPLSEKHNFRITDDNLGIAGAKGKFKRNLEAIMTLKNCEMSDSLATPEEQEVMSLYTGWGGLADAFDETKDSWSNEYQLLKQLLTEEEYTAARESTLTAFYTPPTVIRAIYDAIGNMGFKRGNILEPSCGIGNFIGMLPEGMSESRVYGVELDSISGRIAQQLYQREKITVAGYEDTTYPDSFFDIAVGNVPFGQFKVQDKKYDRNNFLIHDYFFAKTLDKVRPGGVIAFITSKGTLDKENPAVRKYIAQRAELLGAIRLPDTTFKASAGTEAVADIIFLQKRDRIVEVEPDWAHLGTDENGITMNQYFVEHPDMIMGEMVMRSGPFGQEPTCKPYDDTDLGELLSEAITNIHAEIEEVEQDELTGEEGYNTIPADPGVRNFSYTVVGGKVYYRENSIMKPVETSLTGENRIKGMVELRDTLRELIDAQLHDEPDSEIHRLQDKLNTQYDRFTRKYGLISTRANESVFNEDNAYFLLCSLEKIDEDGNLKEKADIFTKRTIKSQKVVDRVDTASEALAISLSERANVDLAYMSELTGFDEEKLVTDLKGVIYRDVRCPTDPNQMRQGWVDITSFRYVTADEYLSGNVREKFRMMEALEQVVPEEDFNKVRENKEALVAVQPQDLTAAEIGVRLGSTWIPTEDVQAFVYELLGTPYYYKYRIQVKFEPITAQWSISDKSYDRGNVKASSVYGTARMNAYNIIEETLNLKDVRVVDYVEDENGNKKPVLNKKETTIAQGKQDEIRRAFEEWIWKDPKRRERLCRLYNDKFNSVRPREYSGEHIKFYGMSPEITLRKHQVDAVARIMYGGNSLLAHVVGAGKTFTMVAAAQEEKRIGLCSKSMIVVPNHLISQWASEYLQLYPSANILVATKRDFETKNRKKFCARIATGDYDAIIIGHSQFEKIPVSVERQIATIQAEIDEILVSINQLKYERGERFTIKQLAKTRKQLQQKLEKLNDRTRKDDVVCFEELGIDRLFIDEAHFYKNLAAFTKMRNVAGISQTEAQKSSDLYMKCRYMDELTGGKGVIFATGTPISNSMVELYTMQKYLQYDAMRMQGLTNFDAWASTYGSTVTAIELAPAGTGYRAKTRFAKFFNIPELMSMFKQVADVQTADMLSLPVPKANFHIEKVPASEIQKSMVLSFADRAARVHARMVKSDVDNMLLITNDGRKAALDQRLINPDLEDFEGSKVNRCVQNVYDIWERTAENRSAQLVFCDLSTPHGDDKFNAYDDIRRKLILRGIPEAEIAFIHDADTDVKKKDLFAKVRSGQVRVLMGSTFKMGAGTNVQERLVAMHDLDVPWRPSDLEQRLGRIVRQGNNNSEVDIYRYVTEGTFDSYMYQLLESKQKFISQIMTSKSPVRSAEDVDEVALSYAEIKAIASGNPAIMEKMQLDADVAKLKLQKASHLSQRYMLEDKLIKDFPWQISKTEERIAGYEADMKTVIAGTHEDEKGFSPMAIMGQTITVKADAGKAILEICKKITNPDPRPLGEYRGLKMDIGFDIISKEFYINLKDALTHRAALGQDANGIITRLDNVIDSLKAKRQNCVDQLDEIHKQVESAKAEIKKPFPREAELNEKLGRLDVLNAELNMDRAENQLSDDEEDKSDDSPDKDSPEKSDDRDDR